MKWIIIDYWCLTTLLSIFIYNIYFKNPFLLVVITVIVLLDINGFNSGIPVSFTNQIDRQDILLK